MKFEIDRTGRLTKISMFKARYIFIYVMQIRFYFQFTSDINGLPRV